MAKRIVGIISFMNAAGAQEAMLRLMRQLRLRGYEAEVWFLYEQVPCYRDEPGVSVICPKPRLSPWEYLTTFFRLVWRLRAARPDVVIGFLPLGNVVGLLAAAFSGIRTRIASQRSPGPTFGKVMGFLDRIWGTLGIYQAVICVSSSVFDSFSRYPKAYRSRLCVVHNGIEWVPSVHSKGVAKLSFGLPPDIFLFVATGRVNPQKNFQLAVRTVALVPNLHLAIAGDGPSRRDIKRLAIELGASDRVHLLGNLKREQVRELLCAANGFVQTSFFEGQSNSTLEAMHAGLPIVCSDICMQRETVCDEDGVPAAMLVPLDDPQGWKAAMEKIHDQPAFAADMGRRAKALVERRFGLERMIDGFDRVIVELEKRTWKQAGTESVAGRAGFAP